MLWLSYEPKIISEILLSHYGFKAGEVIEDESVAIYDLTQPRIKEQT